MRTPVFCALLLAATGCLGDESKGDEEELLDETKLDSHLRPTNHGAIPFATPAHAALAGNERYHAWTFELSGDARIDATTSYSVLGQRRTDTVLYLYKEGPTGWGAYVARNDDYGSTTYSQLRRELGAGRYRVLVKGHLASTLGKFKITVGCDGDGCTPVDPDGCLFGDNYNDIPGNPALEVINHNLITAATLSNLSAVDQQRLLRAVHESSHTDVTTPQEALMRVDQGEVNVTWIAEPAAQRMFVAFEYGAGDNSYGAIFSRTDDTRATSIHDGDLYNCAVKRETCLLSDDWQQLKTDPAFTTESMRVVTAANQLTGIAATQAIGAFQQSYEDVTTVAAGLANVDDNKLNVRAMRHLATGTRLDVYEYGAGDTSVGMIYLAGTLTRAGVINDLAIESCTLFD
ncbi:MAG: hypothetical protein H0T42_11530 [Deltaproteobacteria bacterium]|nr:hypothetical protein [Deltaproteobacteria bacterium]